MPWPAASSDAVETCLARAAGNVAFVREYWDGAGAAARAALGRGAGPFAGVPISIKDLFDVAGEPTPAGSRVLAGAAPAVATAPAIARLLAAGFVAVGRTNMTEFAFSGVGLNPHYGTPLSPYDRVTGRIAGGSSSGAAVSVAEGAAWGAIGTDTGGSCRIPAALCGLVGFKPTARRVPLAGVLPLAPSLDSVGPIASSVAQCAALDAVMAGEAWAPPPPVDLRGARLLWPGNIAARDLDGATERAMDRALRLLADAGVVVVQRDLAAVDALETAHDRGGLAAPEAYAWHADLLRDRGDEYDQRVARRIAAGAAMRAPDYVRLVWARARIAAQFLEEMEGFAALVLPTVPIAPPPLAAFATDDEYYRLNALLLRNPSMVNFFDGCAVSIPCHAAGEPPAGLMLAAPAMADRRLLALAAGVEAVLRGGAGGNRQHA